MRENVFLLYLFITPGSTWHVCVSGEGTEKRANVADKRAFSLCVCAVALQTGSLSPRGFYSGAFWCGQKGMFCLWVGAYTLISFAFLRLKKKIIVLRGLENFGDHCRTFKDLPVWTNSRGQTRTEVWRPETCMTNQVDAMICPPKIRLYPCCPVSTPPPSKEEPIWPIWFFGAFEVKNKGIVWSWKEMRLLG